MTTSNDVSLLCQTHWDWSIAATTANTSDSHKFGRQFQAFKKRRGYSVSITKNKIRGRGRALQLRFESEAGKDFNLLGWAAGSETNVKA